MYEALEGAADEVPKRVNPSQVDTDSLVSPKLTGSSVDITDEKAATRNGKRQRTGRRILVWLTAALLVTMTAGAIIMLTQSGSPAQSQFSNGEKQHADAPLSTKAVTADPGSPQQPKVQITEATGEGVNALLQTDGPDRTAAGEPDPAGSHSNRPNDQPSRRGKDDETSSKSTQVEKLSPRPNKAKSIKKQTGFINGKYASTFAAEYCE